MTSDNIPNIVRDYAPILHFHPEEGEYCCFPSDAEEIYSKYFNSWDSFEKQLTPRNLDTSTPCYYEMWTSERMTQLRYWFWYNYNRFPRAPLGLGEHLGDWEHVEVRIYTENKVIWLFSNHLVSRLLSIPEGLTLPKFKAVTPMLDKMHVHAWVALGSHALYPSHDSKPYCIGGVLCDKISADGEVWKTIDNLVDLSATNFYEFQGRWGDSGAPRSPTNEYNNRWRNASNTGPITG
ncbi:MAG: hypothetical protein ACFFEJ_01825 [Candidatus Thorarchaeota archaeon]